MGLPEISMPMGFSDAGGEYTSEMPLGLYLFSGFGNEEKLMQFSYQRYLENYFRKSFDFTGTPIRFILREKKKEE